MSKPEAVRLNEKEVYGHPKRSPPITRADPSVQQLVIKGKPRTYCRQKGHCQSHQARS